MKKALIVFAALLTFSSCAEPPEDVKSRAADKASSENSAVNYGNIMIDCEPAVISAEKFYILTSPRRSEAVADDKDAKMLCDAAKAVFGIELDPASAHSFDEDSKDGLIAENDQCFCEIGHNGGFMLGSSVIRPPEGFKDPGDEMYQFIRYSPENYPSDKLTMLDGKQMTIEAAIKLSSENIKKLEDIGMFDDNETLRLSGIYTADTGLGTELILTYDQVHYGLPLDDAGFIAPSATESAEAGSAMRSGHLTVMFLNTQMPDMIRNFWDYRFEKAEEVKNLISFEDAARILSKALAENIDLTVSEAALKYCCYYTAGDDINVYRPMWTFLLKEQKKRFGIITLRPTITGYVDAITGEVYYSDFELRVCQRTEVSLDSDSSHSVINVSPSEADTSEAEGQKVINALVKSYKNGDLVFEYEGKEYSLKMPEQAFENDCWGSVPFEKSLSERLIEMKAPSGINAELTVNGDISEVKKCDMINANGKYYHGIDPKDHPDEDISYSMQRTAGSMAEIWNKYETITVDLNDQIMQEKVNYPSEMQLGGFTVYKLNDGGQIFIGASIKGDEANDAQYQMIIGRTAFLAAVQSVANGTAEIILNDGKTTCTVPTFFNNGEIKTGAKVIVMLEEEPSLYGSGEHRTYDYAVIYADTAIYDTENRSFENDAYGIFRTNGSTTLRWVSIKEAEKAKV